MAEVAAEAAAVEAAVLANAAATFTARCAQAAEALFTAATDGNWVDFASAREEAVVLKQQVQHAEAAMSQRRSAASTAVSAAVDRCLEGLSMEQALPLLTSKRVHKHQQATKQSLQLPCPECCGLTESPHILTGSAEKPPLQSAVTRARPFQGRADNDLHSHTQHIITAITQATSTVRVDADKPDWEVAITALSDVMSQAATATVQSQPTESNSAVTLAAALTAARQLGLLQTVELALQTLLAEAQLQLQSHQAVVAEFDLPTEEHPQELCTLAWQHLSYVQQGRTQATQARAAAVTAVPETQHELPTAAMLSAALDFLDRCSAESEVEQAEVGSQLVVKLHAGQGLGLYRLSPFWFYFFGTGFPNFVVPCSAAR